MEATGQWADSLASLERLFHLKLLAWGALSALTGSLLLLFARRSAIRLELLESLALVLLAAGAAEVVAALVGREAVSLRDLGSATSLDRALWLIAGFAFGSAFAATVAAMLVGRSIDHVRRSATVGACVGIALHGAAIALLCLQLSSFVVR